MSDAEGVTAVVEAANAEANRQAGRPVAERTPERRQLDLRCAERFVERDPEGAWVAASEDGGVVGMAQSIRRGPFWGLSMLFVDPGWQSRGVGRALISAALRYAEGATARMIISSSDPRAMRRYWSAGLRLHPAVQASGPVLAGAAPSQPAGRPGKESDLDLVDGVDSGLRGSRSEDVAFLLSVGNELGVVDDGGGRGYVVWRDDRLQMLGATDEETAKALLWRFLASCSGPATLPWITSAQQWAIDVAMSARMTFRVEGALFVDGIEHPPGPWLPSGWFF